MKKLKLLVAGILLPLITIAQTKTNDSYTIRVTMSNINKNAKMYLAYQTEGKELLDSAMQKNGVFVLTGLTDRPLRATLVLDHENIGIQQLIKKSKKGDDIDALKLFMHPGIINIKTDKLIKNAIFSGSVINADNERLKAMLKLIDDQRFSISNQIKSITFSADPAIKKTLSTADSIKVRKLYKQIDSVSAGIKPIFKKFIEENPNSYVSLENLRNYGGGFPDLAVIEPMYNKLSAAVRNTVVGKEYYTFLMNNKYMVIGTKAPGFTQNDTVGKPISLSSFKGKYVLLDFWASWCGPCRVNNPKLVQVYDKFKDKNFTILGISLDAAADKKLWLKAIKDDHLNWPQVSDLKKWDNNVAKLYSIWAIPQSFLIDPNGIIIAKNMEPKELHKKLEEILTK